MAWSSELSKTYPPSPSQNTNLEELATKRPSSGPVAYGRQRSVFPLGIVSEYDLKDASTINASVEERFLPGNIASSANKWNSSPCLNVSSSNNARWGTKILQNTARYQFPASEETFDSLQLSSSQSRVRRFRRRMYSCPSSPVSDMLRVEVPKISSIMVRAHSVPLVTRCHSSPPKMTKSTSGVGEKSRRTHLDAGASSEERSKKNVKEQDSDSVRSKMDGLSKSVSDVKIEDGVIMLDDGKFIDLRADKPRKKESQLKTSEATKKSQSYREFQEALQKFEDAQLNLQGEVTTKPKTYETRDKEEQFFNENVQTQFLDLFSSVKEKRKNSKKGKKYRC